MKNTLLINNIHNFCCKIHEQMYCNCNTFGTMPLIKQNETMQLIRYTNTTQTTTSDCFA